jgi:hypothetical protein
MPAAVSIDPRSFADAAEGLMARYERWLPLATVTAVVTECRLQLSPAAHQAQSPRTLYRIANERLQAMTARLEPGT